MADRSEDQPPGSASIVAQHYNARPEVGVQQRKESQIYYMKNLNNWVKSCLIARYVRPRDAVLDLCCGKGGDLKKWQQGRIDRLVGVGSY
jgi:mRNA (guanine-N7-)-methyltransferase